MWFEELGGVTPITQRLYRSPIPQTRLHARAIAAAGVRTVFSLEEATPGDHLLAEGLAWRPHFWTDDAPPTPAQADAFLADLADHAHAPALVHCKAGWGRTGTAIACALVREGLPAERALRHFWSRVPRAEAVMTRNGQAEFVRGFAARVRGRGVIP
jgi:protein-tyrosine phosphatase